MTATDDIYNKVFMTLMQRELYAKRGADYKFPQLSASEIADLRAETLDVIEGMKK